jgi:hypothetical protein
VAAVSAALLSACASAPPAPPAGAPVRYTDVGSTGMVAGVGTESQDIVSLTDAMVRDLLASPIMAQISRPPRILVDLERFEVDGSQRINKALIIDRLRINLQRASAGRLAFVSREALAATSRERELKERGVTDAGTLGTLRVAGVDYLMRGRMATQDKRSTSNGMVERYTQFSFELIEAGSDLSVWANVYDFQKGGRDDAVYR